MHETVDGMLEEFEKVTLTLTLPNPDPNPNHPHPNPKKVGRSASRHALAIPLPSLATRLGTTLHHRLTTHQPSLTSQASPAPSPSRLHPSQAGISFQGCLS